MRPLPPHMTGLIWFMFASGFDEAHRPVIPAPHVITPGVRGGGGITKNLHPPPPVIREQEQEAGNRIQTKDSQQKNKWVIIDSNCEQWPAIPKQRSPGA